MAFTPRRTTILDSPRHSRLQDFRRGEEGEAEAEEDDYEFGDNCEVSQWGPWSHCSLKCQYGTQ